VPRQQGEDEVAWRLRSLNCPATPSLSLALAALTTETTALRLPSGAETDAFELAGQPAGAEDLRRLIAYLDLWRGAGLLQGCFSIASRNNFPTAAGLASSASGYAALATALSGFTAEQLTPAELSRWARRGSGSAARSVPGGLAALETRADPAAHLAIPAAETPLAMAVCIVTAPPKDTSSRAGMGASAATSPFYAAWLGRAQDDYDALIETLWQTQAAELREEEVLQAAGSVAEADCLAMHAVMQTTDPPLLYWSPATLAVIHAVRGWRSRGWPQAYFTIDAGPHVALLCLAEDLPAVVAQAEAVPGVERVIPSLPGGPAAIIDAA
jgi:diphosphomevalonate decarboxylase